MNTHTAVCEVLPYDLATEVCSYLEEGGGLKSRKVIMVIKSQETSDGLILKEDFLEVTDDDERKKSWVFTSFTVDKQPVYSDKMRYLIYQLEETKSGKKHWQGFVQFKNKVMRGTVMSELGMRCWCEMAVSPVAARFYCMPVNAEGKVKERVVDKFVEFGEFTKQGDRTLKLMPSIRRGDSLEKISEEHGAHQMLIAEKVIKALLPEATKALALSNGGCEVIYLERAFSPKIDLSNFERDYLDPWRNIYLKDSGKWWNDYRGQVVCVVAAGVLTSHFIESIAAGRPVQVETKNGFMYFCSEKLFVEKPMGKPKMKVKSKGDEKKEMMLSFMNSFN